MSQFHCDGDAIDLARGASDPRAELMALIEATTNPPTPAPIDFSSMTVRELCEAASKAGVDQEAIEYARDGDDPQAVLIAPIEAIANPPAPAPIDFSNMTVRELREAASKAGVDQEAIEHARDGDDPKAELITLITAQAGP
jgi:hypothetical protein